MIGFINMLVSSDCITNMLPVCSDHCWFSYLDHLLPVCLASCLCSWKTIRNVLWLSCWLIPCFPPGSLSSCLAEHLDRPLPILLISWLNDWLTDCSIGWQYSMLAWWLPGWMDLDGHLPRWMVVHWIISKLDSVGAGKINGWLHGWKMVSIVYCRSPGLMQAG